MKKIVCNVSLMLAVIFMGSCSSDSDLSAEALMSSPKTERGSSNVVLENNYKEAENKDNPMDYYGIIHNDVLEKVVSKGFKDADSAVKYSYEVLKKDFGDKDIDLGTFISIDEVKSIVDDNEDFYINVVNKSTSDDKAVNEATLTLFKMLNDYSEKDYISYPEVKDMIVSFEKEISYSDDLNKVQKDRVLKCTAIARYSFYFWSQKEVKKSLTAKKKWWQWLIVGAADAAGAASGGVAGAVGASSGAMTVLDWTEK